MPSDGKSPSEAWDLRVMTDPYLWMAEHVHDLNQMNASGERDLYFLLKNVPDEFVAQARLLDIGCGIGRLAFAAGSRVISVTAADISPAALAQATDYLSPLKNTELVKLNGKDLTAVNGEFEIIICFATLSHLPALTLLTYLKECFSLATATGYVLVQLYVGDEHQFPDTDSFSIRSYTRENLFSTMEKIGFVIEEVRDLPLPFDGTDHRRNRSPIIVTLRRGPVLNKKVDLSSLVSAQIQSENSSTSEPSDEEGLILREVNSFLVQHDLASAQRLLHYWVTVNPNCQPEIIDTLHMINDTLSE